MLEEMARGGRGPAGRGRGRACVARPKPLAWEGLGSHCAAYDPSTSLLFPLSSPFSHTPSNTRARTRSGGGPTTIRTGTLLMAAAT